jgi:hypothetical protein
MVRGRPTLVIMMLVTLAPTPAAACIALQQLLLLAVPPAANKYYSVCPSDLGFSWVFIPVVCIPITDNCNKRLSTEPPHGQPRCIQPAEVGQGDRQWR